MPTLRLSRVGSLVFGVVLVTAFFWLGGAGVKVETPSVNLRRRGSCSKRLAGSSGRCDLGSECPVAVGDVDCFVVADVLGEAVPEHFEPPVAERA